MQPIVLSGHLALPADPWLLFIPRENKTPLCSKSVTGYYEALHINKSSFLPKSQMMKAWKWNQTKVTGCFCMFQLESWQFNQDFHSAKKKVVGELCHVFVHKVVVSSVKQILRIKLSNLCGVASYICYSLHCGNISFYRVLNIFNSSFYHFLCFSWNPHRHFQYAFRFSFSFLT